MTPRFFDSHIHLTSKELLTEADALMARAEKAGVQRLLNICTDSQSLQAGVLLAEKYPQIYLGAALTPNDAHEATEEEFAAIAAAAQNGQLKVVGETGLDYYYDYAPKELQQALFIRHLELAKKCNLPVVIHCRDAFRDLYALLDSHAQGIPVILHCFTGTLSEAKQAINRGFYISFSGIVTFKKSVDLQEVAGIVPKELLLIETDAPYLAPQGHRGERNEPAFITVTAKTVADLRGISLEELAALTFENATKVINHA